MQQIFINNAPSSKILALSVVRQLKQTAMGTASWYLFFRTNALLMLLDLNLARFNVPLDTF